jgi:vacuolar-type H+-ATPase subunit H
MAASEFDRTIPGFQQFLADARKLGPEFSKELRKQAIEVAKYVVGKAQQNAGTPQEKLVAKGLQARSDRVPKIAVKSGLGYVSKSRPNARRKPAAKAKIMDVWFGVEFGGGKYGAGNKTPRKSYADGSTKGGGYTTQFKRPHLGRTGYFFYPTVRKEGPRIDELYGQGVDRAMRHAFKDRVASDIVKTIARGIG